MLPRYPVIQRVAILLIIMIANLHTFAQRGLSARGVNISPAQLQAFREAAEIKKNSFIHCVERITRNTEEKIRQQNKQIGIRLFEDTAHIQVSNARRNTISRYTPSQYFNNVVANYHSTVRLTTVRFWASSVTIDKLLFDKGGRCTGVQGHFTFTQEFCKCNKRVHQEIEEIPKYDLCYCDKTTKTGQIIFEPVNTSTGISWVAFLSGIVVNDTSER